jgi:hypothetical protein
MPRYGGKATVESCRSIDVLRWNQFGYLKSQRCFVWAWTRDGEQVASIDVETSRHFVTLRYRSRSRCSEDWSDVEQRIQVNWSRCRLGGERPWFACSVIRSNGRFCGRRCTKLYGAGRLFACRNRYQLAYASQQESARYRGVLRAQRIRMRLGGSANLATAFPDKPKGMHWRTYNRLRRAHDLADRRATVGVRGQPK